jgi:hypothetical protein
MTVDPYEALASLIERELELVAARDFDGLHELSAERAALVRTMPPAPPASARDALLRCHGLQTRVGVELARVREAIVLELRQVRLAQRTAAGYRPAVAHTPHIVASA